MKTEFSIDWTHWLFGVNCFDLKRVGPLARRQKIIFELTDTEIRTLTKAKCSYCGVSPKQKLQAPDANGPYIYNGIDRADSTVGYVSENCVPACGTCNRAKSNLTPSKWHEWLNRIAGFQNRKSL